MGQVDGQRHKIDWAVVGVVGLVAAAGLALVFWLSTTFANDANRDKLIERRLLPDGRSVTCVVAGNSRSAGVDCDWEHAR